jgi:hypothetical protein
VGGGVREKTKNKRISNQKRNISDVSVGKVSFSVNYDEDE